MRDFLVFAAGFGFGALIFCVVSIALYRSARGLQPTENALLWRIILIGICLLAIYAASPILITALALCLDPGGNDGALTKAGQFGDLFGAVNTLFSGMAVTAAFFAFFWQRRETHENVRLSAITAELSTLPTLIEAERAALARIEGHNHLFVNDWSTGEKVAEAIAKYNETTLPTLRDDLAMEQAEREHRIATAEGIVARAPTLQSYFETQMALFSVLQRARGQI